MPSTSASPSSGSSSFFRTELEHALSEQVFGIAGYSMQSSATAHDASAAVTLLERVQIIITLTIRGYQVTGGPVPANENPEFEDLEALLQHYSPMYNTKRTELLVAKLSAEDVSDSSW
ncbi:hypothetical protein ACEPAF_9700 [Sanghuangporus sanghuang]